MQDTLYTLIPPIVAILVAVWRKNAIEALIVGLLLTYFMMAEFAVVNTASLTVTGLYEVVSGTSNLRIIIFSLLIGAILKLINESGGVSAFIHYLSQKNWVNNERKAALLPAAIGSSIFTDTNLSMFTAGLASQSVFDKYKLSRARLAYILDSTCSPISILLLINGWGAYLLGLLDGYELTDTVGVLASTIMYNFYPILVLLLVYWTAFSNKVYGPMKHTTPLAYNEDTKANHTEKLGKVRYMVVPMALIVILTLALLYITGEGDLRRGSGSFSVMWAIITAFVVLSAMLFIDKKINLTEWIKHTLQGIKDLAPAVLVLVLSFAFGDAVKAFGTGTYVSGLMSMEVALVLLAPLLFITAGIMAFATGTSWGTFAILIPIAVPLALTTGIPPAFLVAAVLGGGVFGDHSSPISDSTIVASIASGCEHIEHVKTQLPYNLFAAGMTLLLYLAVGLIIL